MSTRLVLLCMCLMTAAGGVSAAQERASVSSLIAQYYPVQSLERGEEGTVEFAVEVDREARIESCGVTKSSGYRRLDIATCDLLVVHGDFSFPVSESRPVATARIGRLVWKLPSAYRHNAKFAPPPTTVTAAELAAQRLICRRTKGPGSMLKLSTYCLTRSQWAETRSQAQQQGQDMINPRQVEHGCPPHLRC